MHRRIEVTLELCDGPTEQAFSQSLKKKKLMPTATTMEYSSLSFYFTFSYILRKRAALKGRRDNNAARGLRAFF